MTTLTTARLTLRPPQDADTDELVRGLGNFNVSRWTGRVPYPYGPADAQAFLSHCQTLPADALVLVILRQGEAIGVMGIEQGELGYWLAEPHWGQGYGTEAARAVTDHAFMALGHTQLVASYHQENEGSRRILLGLGFRKTGESSAFSKARGAEVPIMCLELTQADWEAAKERRR
ncbi:GNAT family N-acetyltransferase [Aestuariivirga sp.]|uniref:GNAT family N-acetyltransferase n=1 Tax=Aestuariivirga sp. TaxID=2650926 RepID=UPI003BAAB56C